MNWMNASAAVAADRKNAEWSAWDHSVESPDGKGRRDANDPGVTAARSQCPVCKEYRAMPGRMCPECQTAAVEASRLAAVAKGEAEQAAFLALPSLAASSYTEYENIDQDSCETVWKPIAGWEYSDKARVTEGSWGWNKRGPVAKIAPNGWEWPIR